MLQEFFLLIPKGNSKSSYGGPLMLTATIMNRRPEAGFSIIAPTIKVAEIAFNQAEGTIRLDQELDKLFHIQRHIRTITHRTTGASLKIKAADTDVVTGGKDVGTMIDETHVFAKKSDAAAIFVELRGALRKRPDGFLFQTTTQSKEPPSGQFKAELEQARAVRDGLKVRPLLPILYEYPEELLEDNKWKEDRRLWPLVNPNMGRSIGEEGLAQQLEDAEEAGPDQLMLVASQHFNIQIGLRMRGDRWAGADHWEAAAAPEVCRDLDTMLARCEVAVVGGDGGGLDDLFGAAVVGRDKRTGVWLYWNHAFAHRKVLERRKEIAPLLLDFEKQGDLTFWGSPNANGITVASWLAAAAAAEGEDEVERPDEGSDEDVAGFVDVCRKVRAAGLLPEHSGIGLDPAMIGATVDALVAAGFEIGTGTRGDIVAVSQSVVNLFSAINTMERRLEAGTAAHGGTELMNWCVGNAKAELRGNSVAITKAAAGKAKIDPLVASFVATKLMERNPEAAGASVYATRGLLTVG
jgi:phage terminase large subunit-like protein